MKDFDPHNIDTMRNIINSRKVQLVQTRLFQDTHVSSWNINALIVSWLMYLEISKLDEVSNEGGVQVLVEMFHDFGLIEKDPSRKCHFNPVPSLEQRRLRVHGDWLSIEKSKYGEQGILYSNSPRQVRFFSTSY